VFPWHILAHVLTPTPPGPATATAKDTAVKEAKCEQCDCEYFYQVFRSATGRSTAFLVADHHSAQQQADEELLDLLIDACDPVPCPNCGWYQQNMVARARQIRFGWLSRASFVFFLISCFGLFIVAVGADEIALRDGDVKTLFAGLQLWGAAFIPAAVLFILKRVLTRRYDPNAADRERRIDLARYRAVTKKDYLRGVLPRDANPDTRDGNPLN
jgi:hypothetical protein